MLAPNKAIFHKNLWLYAKAEARPLSLLLQKPQKNQIMEYAKKFGTRFGIYMGIIGVLYSVIIWAIDESLFIKLWWLSLLLFLVALGLFVAAQVQTKKALGGYASFREVFSAFMIGAIVYMLISTAFGLLLFQVIDPDLGPRIKEQTIVFTMERLENMGLPDEALDEQLAKLEEQDQYSVVGQLKSFLMGTLFFAVVGAIASLITRKNKPEWEAVDNTENES